ncbi:MAG: hypothetical protein FJY65_00340 [Calditrichaeota bacterium]|nr:hypothetical protein [Calditrichota bacterium]
MTIKIDTARISPNAECVDYFVRFSGIAALGVLASAIMHDTRNALSIITGNAQLLQMKGASIDAEEYERRLELIVCQIERIERALGRVESFRMRAEGKDGQTTAIQALDNTIFALKSYRPDTSVTIEGRTDLPEYNLACPAGTAEFVLIESMLDLLRLKPEPPHLSIASDWNDSGLRLLIGLIQPSALNAADMDAESTPFHELWLNVIALRFGGKLTKEPDHNAFRWDLFIPWEKKRNV